MASPSAPGPAPEPHAPGGYVLDLAEAATAPLSRVGGKALNLGRMVAAGLPVPRGFCLTTDAYRLAAPPELADLAAALDAGIPRAGLSQSAPDTGAGPDTGMEAAAQAARARDLVGAAPIPPAVESAVRAAYLDLGPDTPVAVRSSATAEDLPFASFAGQQDSFTGIVGADAVLDAVRRCWASLWTDRAVAYRTANGISHTGVGLAVVVQAMVEASTAGVMFTANPVTGTRTEMLVNASPGAGQAVVSGAVNPDQFTVQTATAEVLHRVAGDDDPDRGWSLDDAGLAELTRLGASVQRLFGSPQDVEWVVDAAGRTWLTQSRPITTLYPLEDPMTGEPLPVPPEGQTRVYLCGTLLQGLTRPITPMGLTALELLRNQQGLWRYVNPGLRMFVDLTPLTRSRWGRRYLTRVLPLADSRSAALVPGLLADPRFAPGEGPSAGTDLGRVARRLLPGRGRADHPRMDRGAPAEIPAPGEGPTPAERPARVGTSLGMLADQLPRLARAILDPRGELRRTDAYARRLDAVLLLPGPATAEERLHFAENLGLRTTGGLLKATLPGFSAGYLMLAVARRLLRGIAPPRELEAVLRGLPHNVTTEMDLELWRLAVTLRDDPESRDAFLATGPATLAARYRAGTLPDTAQSAVRDFLARYGHRAVAEIDLGMPRWAEEPDHILGVISNYLRLDDPDQAPDRQFGLAAAHAEERIRSLVDRAAAHGRWRARLLGLALREVRELAGLRELPKFHIVRILAEVHRQLLLVGEDLVHRGAVAAAADVFFLDFGELRTGLRGARLQETVAARRRLYDVELRRRHIPRLLLSDGTDVEAAALAAAPPSGALAGTPASAGSATGTVRVVLDPVGARLEPGEILVAPSTDPGWTPLFLTAGALVMEMGGVISHGAVVAREYGIPAVVGVPDATTRLRTGQLVTVDGAAGTVRLVPD
ncbi:PEP/pyruvate-binding domain-containing protein [Arthrobacter sp. BPSS-3]|uniref:PEP/pyruvate-binding domain-containing protein n=1 Tax=Arthrobacter sp. BPSS-3 TaxID=3366580 RepID=UPI0037DDA6C6